MSEEEEVRELIFSCCLCGEHLSPEDPEASQLVVLSKWFKPMKEWKEQYWWVHRRPCLEAAMVPMYREFRSLYNDDEEEDEMPKT